MGLAPLPSGEGRGEGLIDTFAAAVSNLEGIIRFSRRDIVDAGLLDAATFDAFEREFHEWSQLPDAALWYAICFAEGRKPLQ